eukprot:1287041-Rhodomonas_salina.2
MNLQLKLDTCLSSQTHSSPTGALHVSCGVFTASLIPTTLLSRFASRESVGSWGPSWGATTGPWVGRGPG